MTNTPFCNWRWPIAKTDSTQEQNSAPHPAVGAERLADVRNNSAKFGFSLSFSITSTLCVKNGISSKQCGIHSKRFDKVPDIRTNVMKLTAHWPSDVEMPKVVHNVKFTMTNVQSVLLIGQSVVEFIEVFRSMTNCRICRRIVMEHWPNANEKRCIDSNDVRKIAKLMNTQRFDILHHLIIYRMASYDRLHHLIIYRNVGYSLILLFFAHHYYQLPKYREFRFETSHTSPTNDFTYCVNNSVGCHNRSAVSDVGVT